VEITDRYALTLLDNTTLNTADTNAADELVIVDRGNEKLKRIFLLALGSRHIFDNGIEKGLKVCTGGIGVEGCSSCSARAEEHRRIKLLVSSVKLKEKLKNLVSDLVKTGIGAVNLIYNYDYSVVKSKCALKNESGLRHRALCRINEKDNAVYHFEDSLYLASEVRVAGSIDYVDLNVLIMNGCVFCKNGYSALTLQVA
jgi:hypothetical protein